MASAAGLRIITSPDASTTIRPSVIDAHHGVEQLGARGGPGLGLDDAGVQRGALVGAQRQDQHDHGRDQHVDLDDDRPRGEVLDLAERAAPVRVYSTAMVAKISV